MIDQQKILCVFPLPHLKQAKTDWAYSGAIQKVVNYHENCQHNATRGNVRFCCSLVVRGGTRAAVSVRTARPVHAQSNRFPNGVFCFFFFFFSG